MLYPNDFTFDLQVDNIYYILWVLEIQLLIFLAVISICTKVAAKSVISHVCDAVARLPNDKNCHTLLSHVALHREGSGDGDDQTCCGRC